ncbi:hypothetical protein BJ085DRAFT_33441 [Dimargaris cristalligena]|uniref:Uncharacterized protein n=1 Tax=Dimargaris cristalligena TaxID=215637 RepID=A0A4P9ZRF6_9FUNG|nr:hypothetical protein BJ085DRAFT_33441 [Dimargaris cristalligena]|eukprot:RKP35748.1 hypothetical protein BJ085DRAFT_33441 [Dimargaris cristalligena]
MKLSLSLFTLATTFVGTHLGMVAHAIFPSEILPTELQRMVAFSLDKDSFHEYIQADTAAWKATSGKYAAHLNYATNDESNEISSYWGHLFKQETMTNFKVTFNTMYAGELQGSKMIEGLSTSFLVNSDSYGYLFVKELTDRSLWLNFPILTLASKLPAGEVSKLLHKLLRSSLHIQMAQIIAVNVDNAYRNFAIPVMLDSFPQIFDTLFLQITWYLYTRSPFEKVKAYFQKDLLPGSTDVFSDIADQVIYQARLGLVLAASKYESNIPLNKKLEVEQEIKYFLGLAGWDKLAKKYGVTLDQHRNHFLGCLANRQMLKAHNYLSREWPESGTLSSSPANQVASEEGHFVVGGKQVACAEIMWDLEKVDYSDENDASFAVVGNSLSDDGTDYNFILESNEDSSQSSGSGDDTRSV